MLRLLYIALTASLVACAPWPQSNPNDPERCDPVCGAGKRCLRGACVAAVDAGLDAAPDKTIPDAPGTDTLAPDKATPDAPLPDAPLPDKTIPDSLIPDKTIPDAPFPDKNIPDAPLPDKALPDLPLPDLPPPDQAKPDQKQPDAGPPCGKVTWEGCCKGQIVQWCKSGQLVTLDCSKSPKCGWSSTNSWYDCNTSGSADPKSKHPKYCPGYVPPDAGPPDSAPPDSFQPDVTAPPKCGDGKINGNEKCDGSALGGKTCQTMGYLGGQLKCADDCSDHDPTPCFWVFTAGGAGDDYGTGIDVEKKTNKEIWVAGQFQSTATFGSTTLKADGANDLFVARLSQQGKLTWVAQVGAQGGELTEPKVAVDPFGNASINGYIARSATANSYTPKFGTASVTHKDTAPDIFVARMNPTGNFQWVTKGGSPATWDGPSGIVMGPAGDTFTSGFFYGTATFGTHSVTSKGSWDLFVARTDKTGKFLWVTATGSSGADHAHHIAGDVANNSYIVGDYTGTATFGSTTLTSKGLYDMFVAKVDSTGKFAWATSAGGVQDDAALGVAVSSKGVFITGFYRSSVAFGSTTLTSKGGTDIFVSKLDSTGKWVWATSGGGTGGDEGDQVALDKNGMIAVVGKFSGAATLGNDTLTSKGSTDVFVSQLDGTGKWTWADQAGGAGEDKAGGVAACAPFHICVVGTISGAATFNGKQISSKGKNDTFVWKVAPPTPL